MSQNGGPGPPSRPGSHGRPGPPSDEQGYERAEDVPFPWRFALWWAAGIALVVAVAVLIDASEVLGG